MLVAILLMPQFTLHAGYEGISDKLLTFVKERYGYSARSRLEDWQELISSSKNLPDLKKIQLVNRFFNKLDFISDADHWAQLDYWATPIEFIATNGGDCEDFSIAKYFTLRELGIPSDKLRITYVKAIELNQAHMVLAFYQSPNAIPLILDNLKQNIVSADQRNDLKPVYSFNAENLWLAKKGRSQKAGSANDLNLWHNLNKRIADELSL